MSLTATDLLEIRSIVKDVVNEAITPLQGELEDIRNDIEEIYDDLEVMKTDVKEIRKHIVSQKAFKKLTVEDKLLTLNSQLLEAAKQAGISLPR